MNINISQNSPTTNFKATKIATAKAAMGRTVSEFEIYKLGRSDQNFIEKLSNKVNFVERCKNFSSNLAKRWQKIFNYCIEKSKENDNITYVTLSNNKPCGIMTYSYDGYSLYLNGICSIPDRNGNKTPFCGQTLFYQLFKDAQEDGAKSIKLDAVQDGPFDVISKYEKLGFKKDPTTIPYTRMICGKYKIKEQLKELPFLVNYSKSSPERTNLEFSLN